MCVCDCSHVSGLCARAATPVSLRSRIADLHSPEHAVSTSAPPPPSTPTAPPPTPGLISPPAQPDTAHILSTYLAPYHKQLKAAHINAQSLRCHIDEVRAIFRPQNFDIIAISESWLKPCIPDSEVSLPGYIVFRNDRVNKKGGGISVYVKNSLNVKHLYSTPQEYAAKPEFMFLEICLSGQDALLLGVCYRPPRVGHMADFENILLHLLPSYGHVLIMGDFNTDLLRTDNHDYRQLTTMFESCNMTILPLAATDHIAGAAICLTSWS